MLRLGSQGQEIAFDPEFGVRLAEEELVGLRLKGLVNAIIFRT